MPALPGRWAPQAAAGKALSAQEQGSFAAGAALGGIRFKKGSQHMLGVQPGVVPPTWAGRVVMGRVGVPFLACQHHLCPAGGQSSRSPHVQDRRAWGGDTVAASPAPPGPGPAPVSLLAAGTRVCAVGSRCWQLSVPLQGSSRGVPGRLVEEESPLTTCWMTLARKDSFYALFWHPATSPWLGYVLLTLPRQRV